MNKLFLLSLLCLLLSCGIGDIGSESNSTNTTTSTDNSENNGISECTITCEPVEGGFIFQQECTGQIIDGPEFSEVKPKSCVVEGEVESEEIITESTEPTTGSSFII